MIARIVARWRTFMMCGMILVGVAMMPQITAAHGVGRSPVSAHVIAAPGETEVVISLDTEIAQNAVLAMWSNDVAESYQSLSPASDTLLHSFTIMGLNPDTRYYYEILLQDASGDFSIVFADELRTSPAPVAAMPDVSGKADGMILV